MSGPLTLDTSGRVECAASFQPIGWAIWPDLDPFTQGYIEALFAGFIAQELRETDHDPSSDYPYGFSDLAPETLAAILKDCEAFRGVLIPVPAEPEHFRDMGDLFWDARQRGMHPAFPPLTASLGDDGKVYLRSAA